MSSTVCWRPIRSSVDGGTGPGTDNLKQRKRPAQGRPVPNRMRQFRLTSVLRDNRTTPAVVDANRGDIDVLTDAIFAREHAGSNRGIEIQSTGSHEHVVVLEA